MKVSVDRRSLGCRAIAWKSAALVMALALAGCTSTVYKPDVARLSAAVESATTSFQALVNENVAHDIADRDKEFVDRKMRPAIDPECSDIRGFVRDQNLCLVAWNQYRQSPSTVAKPTCVEPVPFAALPAGLKKCTIGRRHGDQFASVPLATTNDAANHLRLAEALAAYAGQLGEIVSADDRDQLEAAVADASAAAQSLQNTLAATNADAKSVSVGPIADFIGTGLLYALEARRLAILKRVVGEADPVVQQASGRLSVFANQLYYINTLLPAYADFEKAVLRAAPEPADSFPARLADASAQEQAYAAAIAITPGDVFAAVADAHHKLLAALEDPTHQIDALKSAIATLSTKAKALADAVKASKE